VRPKQRATEVSRQNKGFARSESLKVRSIINEMKHVCVSSGAVISDGAWISEQGGSLSVHCDYPSSNGSKLLFSIPHKCWIPIDGIEWERSLNILKPRVIPKMTDIQKTLFSLALDLYNETAKISWVEKTLPIITVLNHPKLAKAAQAIEPSFLRKQKPAVEQFIDTRVFREKGRFIVPLADLINHRSNAPGTSVDDYENMRVSTFALDDREYECFFNYNTGLDGFGLALKHGFLDESCQFAYSAPICVNVAGFGNVNVKGTTTPVFTELNVPEIFVENGALVISHIFFDRNRPQRNKALLDVTIVSELLKSGFKRMVADVVADDIFATIVEANLNLLADVQRESSSLSTTFQVAELLNKAACLKADLIRSVFEINAR
jgi:hypothetical protein